LFSKERIKDVSGTISKIDEMLLKGTTVDELGDEVPLKKLDKYRLTLEKRQLENEARQMQGQEPKPVYKTAEEVKAAVQLGILDIDEAEKMLGGGQGKPQKEEVERGVVSGEEQRPDKKGLKVPPKVQPKEPPKQSGRQSVWYGELYKGTTKDDFSDARVDDAGSIWGMDKVGKAQRIARKPPETVRDGTGKKVRNPEYDQYLNLLKEFGLK
jgi:hypothetical protein